jgi:WD40 repeat protein
MNEEKLLAFLIIFLFQIKGFNFLDINCKRNNNKLPYKSFKFQYLSVFFFLKALVALGYSGNIVIWNWVNQTVMQTFGSAGNFIKFLKDGRMVSQSNVTNQINICNIATGLIDLTLKSSATALEQLENGLLASATSFNISFWAPKNGSLVHSIRASTSTSFLKQTSVSNLLASADTVGNIFIWNTTSYSLVKTLNLFSSQSTLLESLSGGHLLSASLNGYLQIWNILAGTCLNTFIPFYGSINTMKLISNNTIALANSFYNMYVYLYQIDNDFQFNLINLISTSPLVVNDVILTSQNILLIAMGTVGNVGFYSLNKSQMIGSYKVLPAAKITRLSIYGSKYNFCFNHREHQVLTQIPIFRKFTFLPYQLKKPVLI